MSSTDAFPSFVHHRSPSSWENCRGTWCALAAGSDLPFRWHKARASMYYFLKCAAIILRQSSSFRINASKKFHLVCCVLAPFKHVVPCPSVAQVRLPPPVSEEADPHDNVCVRSRYLTHFYLLDSLIFFGNWIAGGTGTWPRWPCAARCCASKSTAHSVRFAIKNSLILNPRAWRTRHYAQSSLVATTTRPVATTLCRSSSPSPQR